MGENVSCDLSLERQQVKHEKEIGQLQVQLAKANSQLEYKDIMIRGLLADISEKREAVKDYYKQCNQLYKQRSALEAAHKKQKIREDDRRHNMSTMGNLIRRGANQGMERAATMMPYMNMMYKDQLKGRSEALTEQWIGGRYEGQDNWSTRSRESGRSWESGGSRSQTRRKLYRGREGRMSSSPSTSRTRRNTEDEEESGRYGYESDKEGGSMKRWDTRKKTLSSPVSDSDSE